MLMIVAALASMRAPSLGVYRSRTTPRAPTRQVHAPRACSARPSTSTAIDGAAMQSRLAAAYTAAPSVMNG